jgi:hypothetical protein
MILKNRVPVAAAIVAATVAAVVGCSHADTPTSSGTTTSVRPPSTSVRPAATSSPPATPTSNPEAQPKPVHVTVTPEGDTTVRLGGPPIRFSVTLVNSGPDLPRVGLVVSLGHCSCGPGGAKMMAKGSMRMLDPRSNDWVDVPYVREGTGMDYITQNLVPPFPLSHGQTVTYQLEMQLDADQDGITNGETAIDATVTDSEDPMEGDRFGDGSYHPITVET